MGKSGHYLGYTMGSEEWKGTTKATLWGSQGETLSVVYHGQGKGTTKTIPWRSEGDTTCGTPRAVRRGKCPQ